MTSKTLLLTGHGGYDKLEVVEKPRPSPGWDEVLVNIKANGLNFAELMCVQRLYDRTPPLPAVLGLEGAGDVVEVGEGVGTLKVGDRVMCMSSNFGLWTEFAVVARRRCFVMPEGMSYEEGAATLIGYVTAYHMLFGFGSLSRGQSVLVHMAAGGVGIAATQLCKTVPDVTVFGTASANKHGFLRTNGVDHLIDYRTKDYVEEIRKTSPLGVDLVLDPLSGADAAKGFDLLKPMGKIIHFGAANYMNGPHKSLWQSLKTYFATRNYRPMELVFQNKAACGYHLGHLDPDSDIVGQAVRDLVTLFNEGKIKPKIDSVWAYEDIGKAMRRIHDRLNVGKVIITPRPLQARSSS